MQSLFSGEYLLTEARTRGQSGKNVPAMKEQNRGRCHHSRENMIYCSQSYWIKNRKRRIYKQNNAIIVIQKVNGESENANKIPYILFGHSSPVGDAKKFVRSLFTCDRKKKKKDEEEESKADANHNNN